MRTRKAVAEIQAALPVEAVIRFACFSIASTGISVVVGGEGGSGGRYGYER